MTTYAPAMTKAAESRVLPLSSDVIVAGAVSVARREGVAALTMRRLSEELGVALGATYRYLPSKAAVLETLATHVLDRVAFPGPEAGAWGERLRAVLLSLWDAVGQFPDGIRLLNTDAGARNAARMDEYVRQLLDSAGFPPDECERACAAIYFLSHGVLAGSVAESRPKRTDDRSIHNALDVLIAGLTARLRKARRQVAMVRADLEDR
jgi:AcrR family transcriptional regulator